MISSLLRKDPNTSAATRPRWLLACVLALSASATVAAPSAPAALTHPGLPLVSTGGAAQVRGTSAQLQGTVNPNGAVTIYYFQFGATVAYGAQTTSASIPAGTIKIKVGRPASGILPGYHYRLVATNGYGTAYGRDRSFFVKTGRAKIVISREKNEPPTPYRAPLTLRGSLLGAGNAGKQLVLETSPFPFIAPFEELGIAPVTTNTAGAFTFRVPGLTASTQLRVHTLDPRPVFSPIVTIHVAVRVTLKARRSKNGTLERLYGTVTPAAVGARVLLQVRKAIRPTGASERTSKFATQFATVTRRATKSSSHFSLVTRVKATGRYRAFVQLRKGPLVSGTSPSVLVHATKAPPRKSKKKR
jgi:hypothetical protein